MFAFFCHKSIFVSLVSGVLLILSIVIFADIHVIRLFVALTVGIPLVTFVINLEIFERREKKGMQDDVDYSDERI